MGPLASTQVGLCQVSDCLLDCVVVREHSYISHLNAGNSFYCLKYGVINFLSTYSLSQGRGRTWMCQFLLLNFANFYHMYFEVMFLRSHAFRSHTFS